MTKRCVPGTLCIETYTMIFGLICMVVLLFVCTKRMTSSSSLKERENVIVNNNITTNETGVGGGGGWGLGLGFSWPYFNSDPLLSPFAPPLRDERYLVGPMAPINVQTNVGAVNTAFRQVGLLSGASGTKGTVMALMGRPVFTNRNKWQYYTMSDQLQSVKLPVVRASKSCTSEYGCDQLYSGDTVYVEGISEVYKVTLYDNNTIQYLPF
jgi:hypothetical protein